MIQARRIAQRGSGIFTVQVVEAKQIKIFEMKGGNKNQLRAKKKKAEKFSHD